MEEERSSSSSSSLLNLLRESNNRDETKEDQSLPDDMIFQILLRLQGKSIFKFKCVSKTLNTSILSNPLFHHNYFMQKQQEKAIAASPLTLLGFFYQHLCEEEYGNRDQSREISFLPMCKQGVPIASRGFKQSLGNFIASSNGLVLYGHHPMNYYVCNPITKNWFALPPPIDHHNLQHYHTNFSNHDMDYSWCWHITSKNLVGFYCQEVDDDQQVVDAVTNHIRQCYKVVRFFIKHLPINKDWQLVVKIYSSETGVWKESAISDRDNRDELFGMLGRSSYCNSIRGVFFWSYLFYNRPSLIAYVSNMGMANNCYYMIILTPFSDIANTNATIGESHEGLLQCAIGHDEAFEVYVLPEKLQSYFKDDYPKAFVRRSEWILRHRVSTSHMDIVHLCKMGTIPVAFHAQNSHILYLRIRYKIFCYDMLSGRVDLVPNYDYSYYRILCSPYSLLKPFFHNPESWPLSPLPRQN